MESTTNQTAQIAGKGAADFFSVFLAWVFTPTGAILTLLLILIGGGSLAMRVMGRASRLLSVLGTITAILFFVWIVSGVMEGFGIPVREWIRSIAMQLPDIGMMFKAFFERLLYTAG